MFPTFCVFLQKNRHEIVMEQIVKRENRNYWMGWAIIFIMLCHVQYTCFDNSIFMKVLRFLFKKGEFGVDVFLFLSIIGLCYSYENNTIKDFYINRIRRLFPMYFVFLCLSFVFFKSNQHIVKDVILQITGLSNFMGNQFDEWFIPAIILIYAFFPLLFLVVKWLCEKKIMISVAVVFLLIYSYVLLKNYITPYFACRLYLIPLGIVVYQIHQEKVSGNYTYILLVVALIQLFIPPEFRMYLYVPLLLVLSDKLFPILPLFSVVSWIGKHSLDIYLGQTLGIIYYCGHTVYATGIKLPIGIMITIISAALLYWTHSFFHRIIQYKLTRS